jgi:hypothetical protein
MRIENVLGDIVATTACFVAFLYVWGIWRMVHAKSRAFLMAAMGYMIVTRLAILLADVITPDAWWLSHRSIIIVPQYILFAIAFGLTYYELKDFRFEVPRSEEDKDTEEKHQERMEELRHTTTPTK